MTATPANRKNRFAHTPFMIAVRPPIPMRPGAVPNAKDPSASAQIMKLPVLIAYICMASVKPQGRKKVMAQVSIVPIREGSLWDPTFLPRDFGKVIETPESLGERSVRLIPSRSMIPPTRRVRAPSNMLEMLKTDHKRPSTPPNKANQRILPILNRRCGRKRSHREFERCCRFHSALIQRMRPQTSAMQLDTPAVSPRKKEIASVGDP